jgi:large subunit ribosomal protein L17
MANRKLSRPTDQRKALLRNQVTNLIWYGKLETTLARAKEVRAVAERLITLAARECDNTVEVNKETRNEKEQIVMIAVKNDAPSRLAARRRMMSYLYNMPEPRKDDESKSEYKERTKDVNNPVVEKLLREIGPKYKKRGEDKGPGGYTRIITKGPRRGDSAEMALLELV